MNAFKHNIRKTTINLTNNVLASICAFGMTTAWGANLTVNNLSDVVASGDGQCTLREAITNANTNSETSSGDCAAGTDNDTISFSLGGTIPLGSTLIISDIAGLSIDGLNQNITLNGNNAIRVLQINPSANLTLKNLTVSNGAASGGGFAGSGIGGGGGIYNQFGNLTIDRCTFTGNTSKGNGGAIANYGDNTAAIPNGNLVITNSTFTNNNASFGGAILNSHGKIWSSHLTVVGNSAVTPACPAGFFCTLSINEGGGISNPFLSGAHLQPDFLNLENSIIAGNQNIIKRTNLPDLTSPSDIHGYVTSGSSNLIGAPNGIFLGLQNGVNNNVVGIDVNTVLNTILTNNGGPTQTLALLAGSPAIDSALAINCSATDQRGVTRPQGPGCDIGAFEVPMSTDLAVSGTVTPSLAVVRDLVTLTINVINMGPANATGVNVIDSLPATGLSSITISASQGNCSIPATTGKVTCALGNLANGGKAIITVTGITNKVAALTNTVTVINDQSDPLVSNNNATQLVTVQALLCKGVKPTIVGTPGPDTIKGTRGRDIIHGLGGNDTITGGSDNDVICGGEGNDSLSGESGNDSLDGGAGIDSCNGGAGTDTAGNCEANISIP